MIDHRLTITKRQVILALVSMVSGIICGFLLYILYSQLTGYLTYQQAIALAKNEKYQAATDLLDTAIRDARIPSLKSLFVLEHGKTSRLKEEKKLYDTAIQYAQKGDWPRAKSLWVNLPHTSRYYAQAINTRTVPHEKPKGDFVKLINYTHAKNPTWRELTTFLSIDHTDKKPYDISSFVCTGFAETLHNNAEEAGMRAAYVSITFLGTPGHAITAFKTTDRGTVYIDDTGQGFTSQRDDILDKGSNSCLWDKAAYLEKGKEYGVISLDHVSLDPSHYQFYQTYTQLWAKLREQTDALSDQSKTYEQQLAQYQKDSDIYNQALKEHNKLVSTITHEADQLKKDNENKLASDKESIQGQSDTWSKRKDAYEQSVAQLEAQIKEYNSSGDGNPDELNVAKQRLEDERNNLNADTENLKKLETQLNDKMQLPNTQVEGLRVKVDESKKYLDSFYGNLEKQKNELDIMAMEINTESLNIKQQEKDMGSCYWKSLGKVKNYEIVW